VTWSIGDVLEFVEHPTRMVRCNPEHIGNIPFTTVNRLGKELNRFTKEDQEMYVENFLDTLDQV
jgi:hypothetical protein